MTAMFDKKEHNIPKGYSLMPDKDAPNGLVQYSNHISRYLWHPEKGCLFCIPVNDENPKPRIFKYLEWKALSPTGQCSMDGCAKIRETGKRNAFWVNNIEVRMCIPIVKSFNFNKEREA